MKPSVLKFPAHCRNWEPTLRSRGVPAVAFNYHKVDLAQCLESVIFEAPNRKIIKNTTVQQQRTATKLTRKLFKPQFTVLGTGPAGEGYAEACQFLLWLCFQALDLQAQIGGREPLWYPLYNNRDDRLTRYFPDEFSRAGSGFELPSLLILDNLYPNSSQLVLNKAQDIVHKYRDQMSVLAIAQSMSSYEFSYNKLHVKADCHLQFTKARKVISL